jgi:hypothetical protein
MRKTQWLARRARQIDNELKADLTPFLVPGKLDTKRHPTVGFGLKTEFAFYDVSWRFRSRASFMFFDF